MSTKTWNRAIETDPEQYRVWAQWVMSDEILTALHDLLMFVRKQPIVGLHVGAIRKQSFIPFGGPDLHNRKVNLYLAEIVLANTRATWEDDEAKGEETDLKRQWELSGLVRP